MKPEMFDIYDEEGLHMGTATRQETHAKGYWHHSFHCWVVRDSPEGRKLLFQQRQSGKDTFPGCYDITAAGHLTAGEDVSQAARELQEELSLTVPFDRLTPLMTVRAEMKGTVGGTAFIDRETSSVFGLLHDQPLEDYRLQNEEVAGIYEAGLKSMLQLFEGELPSVEASGVSADPSAQGRHTRTVTAGDFVPRDLGYYIAVCRALLELGD